MYFECREIVYSVVTYDRKTFASLDLQMEIQAWKEELESNSFAKPVYMGSVLDDDDGHMNLDTAGEEEPNSDTVYVVIYYYYEEASYSISDDVENGDEWVVNFDPILSGLGLECAMESVSCGDTTEFFECDSSLNRGETMLAIYNGSEKIMEGSIAELFSAMD